MNRADKMLEVLSDGEPHDRHDIFQRAGCFFLTNNAASELRARGLTVEQWRESDQFFYRLGSLEGAETGTVPVPSSERAADTGLTNMADTTRDPVRAHSPHEQLTLEAA